MITPEQAEAAARDQAHVLYRPHPDAPPEVGVVVRLASNSAAFVRYSPGGTAKATRLADLELEAVSRG